MTDLDRERRLTLLAGGFLGTRSTNASGRFSTRPTALSGTCSRGPRLEPELGASKKGPPRGGPWPPAMSRVQSQPPLQPNRRNWATRLPKGQWSAEGVIQPIVERQPVSCQRLGRLNSQLSANYGLNGRKNGSILWQMRAEAVITNPEVVIARAKVGSRHVRDSPRLRYGAPPDRGRCRPPPGFLTRLRLSSIRLYNAPVDYGPLTAVLLALAIACGVVLYVTIRTP
jgi:hypothetical protein